MEKINLKNANYSYDDDTDILYIDFGNNRPAVGEEIGDYDVVRVDPETDDIVGITLMFFRDRYNILPELAIEKVIPSIIEKFKKHMMQFA